MLTIAHFSDTHGLPRKGVPDEAGLVVLTGDIAPDGVAERQRQWYEATVRAWKTWLRGRALLFVEGNHDFYDPTGVFRRAGILAWNVGGRLVEYNGLTFAGLPEIPWMGNSFNHEEDDATIFKKLARLMDDAPDVIVAHCPPYGVLDAPYGDAVDYHVGSRAIMRVLETHEHEPKAFLCGHCHEQGGRRAQIRSTIVSNAATKRVVLNV